MMWITVGYSTYMYEQFHIALIKTTYQSNNRRNAKPQIVRNHKRLQALRKAVKQIEGLKNQKKVIDTPLKKVGNLVFNIKVL